MVKNLNRVTFEEVMDDFSHYEVAFLSFCKSAEIIQSGVSLLSDTRYKPKVALVAYNSICSDLESTKQYKEDLINKFNASYEETTDDEEYSVDESNI